MRQSKISLKVNANVKFRVTVIGASNCGTAIAMIIAKNAEILTDFENTVNIFVYEEYYEGLQVSEWINNKHVNAKYLPDVKLPTNLVAVTDLVQSVRDADFLVFTIPSSFVLKCCKTIKGKVKKSAVALLLTTSFYRNPDGGVDLISHVYSQLAKLHCSVLVGTNLGMQIAAGHFCELTIACRSHSLGIVWSSLFEADFIRITLTTDVVGVQLCTCLNKLVSIAAGLCDGFNLNENYTPAIIRHGMFDIMRFVDTFFPGCKMATFFQSCGIPALIQTCYGSRGRLLGELMAKYKGPIEFLEDEYMHSQRVSMSSLISDVYWMLKTAGIANRFPLFNALYLIITHRERPQYIINIVETVPANIFHPTTILALTKNVAIN